MKVLWITNILFPEAISLITKRPSNPYGGGWMLGSANSLTNNKNVELYVATVSGCVSRLTYVEGEKIHYAVIPIGKGNIKYNKDYERYWIQIQNKFNPDIVHIHGTEFTQGLAYVKAIGKKNVVVSIQGMKSVISKYYTAGISFWDIISNLTIHDLLKGGIYSERRTFEKSGKFEKDLIRHVDYIIGRTSWDKAHTFSINANRKYFSCNETLLPIYYTGEKWSLKKCKRHSIFLSQAYYPLKGVHIVLKAMPIIINKYPDVSIRIAGDDITNYKGISGLRHNTTYWNYIKKLIHKYGLEDHISFTGLLSPEKMKQEYLNSNVFICPSSIENSPNSLGEAQILGVPCIGSYAGGIPDMMRGDEEHLYRFDDYEMLAFLIESVFEDCCENISMINVASNRHNSEKNNAQLLNIYKEIIQSNDNCNIL